MGKICSTVRATGSRLVTVCPCALLLFFLCKDLPAQSPETESPPERDPIAAPSDRGIEFSPGALLGVVWEHGAFRRHRESLAPGVTLTHYTAGLELDLWSPRRARWNVVASLGIGATRLRAREFAPVARERTGLSQTFLSLHAGLTLEYRVAAHCDLFVGLRDFLEVSENLERDMYESLDRGRSPLESALRSFPLTAGVRFDMP